MRGGSVIRAISVAGLILGTASVLGSRQAAAQGPANLTLPGVTQNWDKNLLSDSRFTVLAAFNNQAVRDNNTGLVWQRSPSTFMHSWFSARVACVNTTIAGTVGWRLPSVVELKSVQDQRLEKPYVPATVFSNVSDDSFYWSSSSDDEAPNQAWAVSFGISSFFVGAGAAVPLPKTEDVGNAWCVRGPMHEHMY